MEATRMAPPLDVRHVLVPLDGSSFAAAALPTARAIADRFGAELSTISVAVDERHAVQLREHARHERGAEAPAAAGATLVVISPDPGAAITEQAAARDGTLLVMSTRGRGRLSGTLFGSVAGDVLAAGDGTPFIAVGPLADRPGWLVGRPRRRPRTWPAPLSRGHIVALIDGTAEGDAAVPVAARWAAALDRELVVLTVTEDATAASEQRPDRPGFAGPVADVHAIAERARGIAPRARAEVILDPIGVSAGVRSYLAVHDVALVVLAATRRTGAARLRRGATAADIVRTSRVPTLIVPSSTAATAAVNGARSRRPNSVWKDQANAGANARADRCDIEDGGVATSGKDLVGGVGGVTARPLNVRLLRQDVIAELVREVELAGEDDSVEVHHQVDVHGPARIPARVDRGELDEARTVGMLAAT